MIIPKSARPYLVAQNGAISDLKGDRVRWEAAWRIGLFKLFETIVPYLPERLDSILDVGGGMGAIDALLVQTRGDIEVAVLDGAETSAKVSRYWMPFNDLRVTAEFLKANGVKRFTPIPADALPPPRPFDLIVSFASFSFHYPPATYLEWIKACTHPGTRLIFDVRVSHPDWLQDLEVAFGSSVAVYQSRKFSRRIFGVLVRQGGPVVAR